MKWFLRLGLAFIVLLAIIFLGISGFLGYSMTRTERAPVEGSPALLGLKCEEVYKELH